MVVVKVGGLAWVPKSAVNAPRLRKALTVCPRKVGDHPGEPPEPFTMFWEDDRRIGVPREYFFKHLRGPFVEELEVTSGEPLQRELKFNGTLREDQQAALNTITNALKAGGRLGGVVQAKPAFGKTVLSCALMAKLGLSTLVVVHKEFLVQQWMERIKQFLPDAEIGRVQQDTCDYRDKDVVIGMVHSLSGRDYGPDFYQWPGLFISDECHRISSPLWSLVPPKFPALWRIGLSATPTRKDGTESVFFNHIGDIIYSSFHSQLSPKVRRVWTDFTVIRTPRFNPSLAPTELLVRFLCASPRRNQAIVDQLLLAVKAGRKIIVLSTRLKHLGALKAEIESRCGDKAPSMGLYVGGMSSEDLSASAECQVILATKQMTAEGLDIPALDTLFITTPMGDIEQAVGRILRSYPGKKDPIVVDFRDDNVPKFKGLGAYRDKQYARLYGV